MRTLLGQVRRDEREGAILPAEKLTEGDKEITTGFKFGLLTSGGSRQIQPDVAIRRHESRMAMTMLAEWLLLGTDKVGSFALASEKTDLFAIALGCVLDALRDVFNGYAVPRLMRLNGIPEALWPKLQHGDLEKVDLAHLPKLNT